MNRTLVALSAIAATVFLVAIFAGAQTVFDGGVTATGAIIGTTINGTTITASTAFAGDLTGDVTGNVTGDLTGDVAGVVFQSVTYKGNLPTTSSGEKTGQCYMNAAGDSGFVADNNSWVQLWP